MLVRPGALFGFVVLVSGCAAPRGQQLCDAIARRDVAFAEKLMLEHLDHIEGSLKLDAATEEVDLEAIFKE